MYIIRVCSAQHNHQLPMPPAINSSAVDISNNSLALAKDLPNSGEYEPLSASEPYVITGDELNRMVGDPTLLAVDLRPVEHGVEGYIPGSVHLDYNRLVRRLVYSEGLLPEVGDTRKLFSELGLKPWHFVVAYDDETGVEAARLLWTLEVAGHKNYALLDGGFAAWLNLNLPVSKVTIEPVRSDYAEFLPGPAVVNKDYILSAIARTDSCIVDTRSLEEYSGEDLRAHRGGHLPGAVHFEWTEAVDLFGTGKLRDRATLRTKLTALGIIPDKEIILYCQSNRRCAHTFLVLKWLGYENVKIYHGSWSEWGNDPHTPVVH